MDPSRFNLVALEPVPLASQLALAIFMSGRSLDKDQPSVFGATSVSPNPPPNLVIRPANSGLRTIPDHQQGVRCKAPRSDN